MVLLREVPAMVEQNMGGRWFLVCMIARVLESRSRRKPPGSGTTSIRRVRVSRHLRAPLRDLARVRAPSLQPSDGMWLLRDSADGPGVCLDTFQQAGDARRPWGGVRIPSGGKESPLRGSCCKGIGLDWKECSRGLVWQFGWIWIDL